MSALDNTRSDIDTIIDETNEFASTVTYTEVVKTYDDDSSTNETTETDYEILALIFPESDGTEKVDKLGQLIFGTAKIFLKYQYIISTTTLTPKVDDIITTLNTKYRITKLKPWSANGGVAYYEGQLVREDLN